MLLCISTECPYKNSPDSSGMNVQALASKNLAAFIGTDSGTFQHDEALKLSLQKRNETKIG